MIDGYIVIINIIYIESISYQLSAVVYKAKTKYIISLNDIIGYKINRSVKISWQAIYVPTYLYVKYDCPIISEVDVVLITVMCSAAQLLCRVLTDVSSQSVLRELGSFIYSLPTVL